MTTQNPEALNQQFAINQTNNTLRFKNGKGDIPVVEVRNYHSSAVISLHGAHVLSWIPKGQEEVIWVSDDAKFAPGKSVRGGIPICWPWFGAHESNKSFPAHGFARTVYWDVISTEALEDGDTRITFSTRPLPENEAMWPPQTTVQYQVTVGKKLHMELMTHNEGSENITIGQALHTYFKVGDIGKVLVHGLDDTVYLDKMENFARKHQHGPVVIDREVDRIYLDTITDCVIEDNTLKRNIVINKCGSHSTVVWNPWIETANKMGDLGVDGYRKMLCVESCNAAEDVVDIPPGKAHHLLVQYSIEPLED
jgi:D-hexose-6-phosphate mutarotase